MPNDAMSGITYRISADRNSLRLFADEDARAELRSEYYVDNLVGFTAEAETDALEWLLCNSELSWVSAVDTGDLTEAPLLGIVDYGPDGSVKVLERWGYEPYQVKSFLHDLMLDGETTFSDNW